MKMFGRCQIPIALVGFLVPIAGCGQNGDQAKTPPATTTQVAQKRTTTGLPCCCEADRTKLLLAAIEKVEKAKGKPPCCCEAEPGDGKSAPLFGGTPARNLVNLVDKDMPIDACGEAGKFKNIKWAVKLGSKSYGGPVIAGGKIFVGTNNASPRDPKIKDKKKAALMCFNEADGKFLWQILHDVPGDPRFHEVVGMGLLSTPVVDDDRLYYVTPSAEVVCAETASGKIVWKFDMMARLDVKPFHCGNCSPLVAGDKLYVVTGNGADENGKVESPKAPSFVAFDKIKGTVVWQSNLPGEKIIQGQWSNPAFAVISGRAQVIFPGGDCWLYSLHPATGELLWKFNCQPQRPANGAPNYIVATPIVHDNKVLVGLGVGPDLGTTPPYSYVVCVDATRSGDISPVDLGVKNPKNKDSGLVWAFGGPINPVPESGRRIYFGNTISTIAAHDGLVYAVEETGILHCLDAKTGQRYWQHDFLGTVWGSPYWVDGKVYVGTQGGDLYVFAHTKESKEKKERPGNQAELAKIVIDDAIDGTPVAVNSVLYVQSRTRLYAIAKGGSATEAK